MAELHLPHSTVALLLSHVPVDVVARNIQLILVGKGFRVKFSGVVQVLSSRERRGGVPLEGLPLGTLSPERRRCLGPHV